MVYDDIKNHYYSILLMANAPSTISSNFHEASKDDDGQAVVENYMTCLKFDAISKFLYPYQYHSSDALFFSDTLKRLLFVEFKNRHYDENDNNSDSTINKIVKQAGDTLFLHSSICQTIVDYNKVESDFVAVIDFSKNQRFQISIRLICSCSTESPSRNKQHHFSVRIISRIPIKIP